MAFTSLLASSVGCTIDLEDSLVEVVDDVTGTAVASGYFGANSSARVQGTTIVTLGIIVGVSYVFVASLHGPSCPFGSPSLLFVLLIERSSSSCHLSIFFSCTISLACGCSVGGSLSYFLNATMSSFFFFTNYFIALTFVGSYPTWITNSSKDLILRYLSYDEALLTFI